MNTTTVTHTTTINPADLKLGEKVFIWKCFEYTLVCTAPNVEIAKSIAFSNIALKCAHNPYEIIALTQLVIESDPTILTSVRDCYINREDY